VNMFKPRGTFVGLTGAEEEKEEEEEEEDENNEDTTSRDAEALLSDFEAGHDQREVEAALEEANEYTPDRKLRKVTDATGATKSLDKVCREVHGGGLRKSVDRTHRVASQPRAPGTRDGPSKIEGDILYAGIDPVLALVCCTGIGVSSVVAIVEHFRYHLPVMISYFYYLVRPTARAASPR
jgi:hypothetical protein